LQLETAQSELESYHARVARAAAEEEAVLADSDLSEHEAIKRLGEAEKLQAIYSSRIAHREGALKKLTVELEADLSAGGRQLTGLLNDELEKRAALAKGAILNLLGLEGTRADELIGPELSTILLQAASIRAISGLRPSSYYRPGELTEVVEAARTVLSMLSTEEPEVATSEALTFAAPGLYQSVREYSRVGPFKCLRGLDNQPFDKLSGRHDITHQGCRLTDKWQQVMASAGPDGG
jgi:hypothetical protein